MSSKVFYSWQSDHPNSTNRSFIERALDKAVSRIRDDQDVEVEPVIDRDTADVPGAPDIAQTIFRKIDECDVFVGDVSILDSSARRPSPNPNVLIELGYAMHALGSERILLVMNRAFGRPELLPFDLRMRRTVTYERDRTDTGKTATRQRLAADLERGLRSILVNQERRRRGPSLSSAIVTAIEEARSGSDGLVREFMRTVAAQLGELRPTIPADTDLPNMQPRDRHFERERVLKAALETTEGLVVDFSGVAKLVAVRSSNDAAKALYTGFSSVLDGYGRKPGDPGRGAEIDFDFHRFIGHELMAIFAGFLVAEERWAMLASLFDERIFCGWRDHGRGDMVPFGVLSSCVQTLQAASPHRGRPSIHADLLNERHTQGPLASIAPMAIFREGDFFLHLRSLVGGARAGHRQWRAWSRIYIEDIPRFLQQARDRLAAERIAPALGAPSVASLRERLTHVQREWEGRYHVVDDIMRELDPSTIGSR